MRSLFDDPAAVKIFSSPLMFFFLNSVLGRGKNYITQTPHSIVALTRFSFGCVIGLRRSAPFLLSQGGSG